jgi:nickel transport protein
MCGTVSAHKLKVFATGEGDRIVGYVYFPGGARAHGLTVVALLPDGEPAGQAVTDDRGEFAVPVGMRCDYTLVAQTPDGHRAEFVVKAAEMSPDLPPHNAVSGGAETAPPETRKPTEENAELRALVEEAVREQVRPLREQLDAYEQEVRFRDVVGGIGYILGLAGIAFYFLGVRGRAASNGKGR